MEPLIKPITVFALIDAHHPGLVAGGFGDIHGAVFGIDVCGSVAILNAVLSRCHGCSVEIYT